jgi:hypothetical protein
MFVVISVRSLNFTRVVVFVHLIFSFYMYMLWTSHECHSFLFWDVWDHHCEEIAYLTVVVISVLYFFFFVYIMCSNAYNL